tara:strand:- start:497 stop:925 length:429 start_codon:yes stop_codon:yes gene_type:complete
MESSFPATMKLVTGEEVLCEISQTKENNIEFFVVSNPIVIAEQMHLNHEKGVAVSGLVPKKWMMYSNDDMTIIYKQHIISISEMDKFGQEFYNKALIAAKCSSPIKRRVSSEENVGFVGKTDTSRKLLEEMYNNSLDVPENE